MTSLADVYEDNIGEVGSIRRLYAGTGLFAAGVVLTVVAMVVAGTNVLGGLGVGVLEARKYAGVLGGLGVPAVLLGVFTVLPASQRVRGAAAIGASVCVLGVALFWHAYPTYWVTSGAETDLTLVVATVYLFGAFTSIWTLFSAIVNFKTRNDPGGTVELRITKEGETRVVEVDQATADAVRNGGDVPDAALGSGIGVLGRQPDGDVETQTGDPDPNSTASAGTQNRDRDRDRSSGRSARSNTSTQSSAGTQSSASAQSSASTQSSTGTQSSASAQPKANAAAASDGGSTTQDITSPGTGTDSPDSAYSGDGRDAEVLDDGADAPPQSAADRYCGNCEHFDYVRTNQGIQPYCGYHDERMDDMEACDAWTPNSQ